MSDVPELLSANEFFTPEFLRDPYPTYRRYLDGGGLQYLSIHGGVWAAFKHADCSTFLRDSRLSARRTGTLIDEFSADKQREFAELARTFSLWMLFFDAPEHTRLRKLMNKGFSPVAIESLKPRVERIVDRLLLPLRKNNRIDILPQFTHRGVTALRKPGSIHRANGFGGFRVLRCPSTTWPGDHFYAWGGQSRCAAVQGAGRSGPETWKQSAPRVWRWCSFLHRKSTRTLGRSGGHPENPSVVPPDAFSFSRAGVASEFQFPRTQDASRPNLKTALDRQPSTSLTASPQPLRERKNKSI